VLSGSTKCPCDIYDKNRVSFDACYHVEDRWILRLVMNANLWGQYGWVVQPCQSYATRLADRVAGARLIRPLGPQVGESRRTLGLLHMNVNSLAAKLDDVLRLCVKYNVQCLSLNEVYGPNAKPKPGHRYQLPGDDCFQGPYDPGEAGSHGVAFAAAKSLNAVEYSASTTAAVFVLIRENGERMPAAPHKILLCSYASKPSCP
jgi:hypothetical protein